MFEGSELGSVQYCTRCCMPETQEGVVFDELGVCRACLSSEQKMHINWAKKEQELKKILDHAKSNSGSNYDCIVPISGGKDSTFQLHVLVSIYKMKPLAVTFNHNWYSKIGWYNLQNSLAQFNVDHIMFTPSRELVNKISKTSLGAIGDACWHCHAGVGSFPLQIAVNFKIPLLIWGESVAEFSGRSSFENPKITFDREYFTKVSAKKTPKELAGGNLSERDLYPFELPSAEACEAVGLQGIHLGDYVFWDEERQTNFVKDVYKWKETNMEGTYKGYKSAECIMAGVHDFTKYLKRGYGRATDHASADIRSGLLSRDEGVALAKMYDPVQPNALNYYLKITGFSMQKFYQAMEDQKLPRLKGFKIPVVENPSKKNPEPYIETFLREIRSESSERSD